MEYIVLREKSVRDTSEPFASRSGSPNAPTTRSQRRGPAFDTIAIERADPTPRDLKDLSRDPSVRAAAPATFPTRLITPVSRDAEVSTDGGFTSQGIAWGIEAIGAPAAEVDGSGATVAVLDTGIDRTHEAFAGIDIIEEDFSEDGDGDVDGHGTHCAGTIFGRDVGGKRIGVARGVDTALIGKVLRNDGRGNSGMIVDGIHWAAREGADVISMSLGFDFPGFVKDLIEFDDFPPDAAASFALQGYRQNLLLFDTLIELVQQLGEARLGGDPVVVAASGNENVQARQAEKEISVSIPAATTGILSVGALQAGDDGFEIADFSNTLPQIAAPGVNVVSAQSGGGLVSLDGTSMATPHVAGIAALFWQQLRSAGRNTDSQLVLSRILTGATFSGLSPDTDEADVGVGLARAPGLSFV